MASSSFLGASLSSSASSPLSYLIPARPPPPVFTQGQGFSVNGVGNVQTSGVVDVASAASSVVAAPPPRPAAVGRTGHPPLPRPPPRQCPRCGSGNTKFCYYNNYSRSQPRYLCRACRRHWTEGGTLRDVPVGGGRKARRGNKAASAAVAKASSSTSSPSATMVTALPLGGGADVAFPDILRQVLFQPVGTMGGGGGYGIDLSAWQQMVAATAPAQGNGDAGALGATAMDANCGALQYWSEWQQDDVPGLDGAC